MDGPEGETHPDVGAKIMHWLFDRPRIVRYPLPLGGFKRDYNYRWLHFTLLHSRFYAKQLSLPFSKLCVADKLAIDLTWRWLYLIQTNLTGEIHEYMKGTSARTPAGDRSQWRWLTDVQRYCRAWAFEHQDMRKDLWTGTRRDMADEINRES